MRPKLQGRMPEDIRRGIYMWCTNRLGVLPSLIVPMWDFGGRTFPYFTFGNSVEGAVSGGEKLSTGIHLTVANQGYVDLPIRSAPSNLPHTMYLNGITFTSFTQYNRIYYSNQNQSNYYGYNIQTNTAGTLSTAYLDGGSGGPQDRRQKTANDALSTGQKYNIAGVLRGATDMSLYANGIEMPGSYSGTGGNPSVPSDHASIGRIYTNSTYYYSDFDIDGYLLLFNVGITTQHVELLEDQPYAMFEPVSRPSYFFSTGSSPAPPATAQPIVFVYT